MEAPPAPAASSNLGIVDAPIRDRQLVSFGQSENFVRLKTEYTANPAPTVLSLGSDQEDLEPWYETQETIWLANTMTLFARSVGLSNQLTTLPKNNDTAGADRRTLIVDVILKSGDSLIKSMNKTGPNWGAVGLIQNKSGTEKAQKIKAEVSTAIPRPSRPPRPSQPPIVRPALPPPPPRRHRSPPRLPPRGGSPPRRRYRRRDDIFPIVIQPRPVYTLPPTPIYYNNNYRGYSIPQLQALLIRTLTPQQREILRELRLAGDSTCLNLIVPEYIQGALSDAFSSLKDESRALFSGMSKEASNIARELLRIHVLHSCNLLNEQIQYESVKERVVSELSLLLKKTTDDRQAASAEWLRMQSRGYELGKRKWELVQSAKKTGLQQVKSDVRNGTRSTFQCPTLELSSSTSARKLDRSQEKLAKDLARLAFKNSANQGASDAELEKVFAYLADKLDVEADYLAVLNGMFRQ